MLKVGIKPRLAALPDCALDYIDNPTDERYTVLATLLENAIAWMAKHNVTFEPDPPKNAEQLSNA